MERMYDIKKKEVINIKDGLRLGFVSDVILDEKSGRIEKLIIPAPTKLFGIFGGDKEYKISWEDIKVMGEDFILIEAETETLIKDNRKG